MDDILTDVLLLLIRILTVVYTIPAVVIGVALIIAISAIVGVAALIASPLYLLYKLENYIYKI
jgi:hypothetical protein